MKHRESLTVLWLLAGLAHAGDHGTAWTAVPGFRVSSTGALELTGGARVELQPTDGAPKTGQAFLVLDAAEWRHKRLLLAGDLAAAISPAGDGAAIYLKPLGNGGSLGFATSQVGGLVRSPEHREVILDVPSSATQLVIGLVAVGSGEVQASHLRLSVTDAPPVSAAEMVEVAIRRVRENALYADRIDWAHLSPRLRDAAKGMQEPAQTYPLIVDMLAQLRDRHSRLLPPTKQAEDTRYGRSQGEVVVKALPGGVGYIHVPGFEGWNGSDSAAFAERLATGIGRVVPDAVHGWVVDLRDDTGGNMHPMLSGLHGLLGSGALGGFRALDGRETPFFSVAPASVVDNPALVDAPVAVLIGPHTSSSGEIVAIAFEGRPQARFFGEPSDGRTTGNRDFPLPDGSDLVLACSMDVDRLGRSYGRPIAPDVVVVASGTGNDAVLDAAVAWLHR